jgi:hypothetical protein
MDNVPLKYIPTYINILPEFYEQMGWGKMNLDAALAVIDRLTGNDMDQTISACEMKAVLKALASEPEPRMITYTPDKPNITKTLMPGGGYALEPAKKSTLKKKILDKAYETCEQSITVSQLSNILADVTIEPDPMSDIGIREKEKYARPFDPSNKPEPAKESWKYAASKHIGAHYFIDADGATGKNNYDDPDRRRNFNYYPTEELAKSEAEWHRAASKLRYIARDLNGNWKGEGNSGCFISRQHGREPEVTYNQVHSTDAGAIEFRSYKAAETALSHMTARELDVLFGRV